MGSDECPVCGGSPADGPYTPPSDHICSNQECPVNTWNGGIGGADTNGAIQNALTHVRTADEWRKRREMDQLKNELNLARAALTRVLGTRGGGGESDG